MKKLLFASLLIAASGTVTFAQQKKETKNANVGTSVSHHAKKAETKGKEAVSAAATKVDEVHAHAAEAGKKAAVKENQVKKTVNAKKVD